MVAQVLRPHSHRGRLAEAPRGVDREDAGPLQIADEVGECLDGLLPVQQIGLEGIVPWDLDLSGLYVYAHLRSSSVHPMGRQCWAASAGGEETRTEQGISPRFHPGARFENLRGLVLETYQS